MISILLSFSVNIEMLRLLLRLGTFQLSDIFYNTVGEVVGGFGVLRNHEGEKASVKLDGIVIY